MTDAVVISRRLPQSAEPWTPRRNTTIAPGIVLIGASTGGPQALIALIGGLSPILPRVPVCVTPAYAARPHAGHCRPRGTRLSGRDECRQGAPKTRGRSGLFRPGRSTPHVQTRRRLRRHESGLRQARRVLPAGDRRHVCVRRPPVTAAARSASSSPAWARTASPDHARSSPLAGPSLVQDKASSAVWGMPGAVSKADLASATLAPRALGLNVLSRVSSAVGSL